ncbi:MAG: hypothetical protein AAF602_15135, partial [Myxococcota bacterium]
LPAALATLEYDQIHFLQSVVASNFTGPGINIIAEGWAVDFEGQTHDIPTSEVATAFEPDRALPPDRCGDRAADLVRWMSDRGGVTYVVVPVVIQYPACP